MRVSNDAPGDAAGLTAGECGKGRLIEQGQQCGITEQVLSGHKQGAYGNVATTVNAGHMGTAHRMLFIINGVSYTVTPGTATDIPRICREVMDNAKDPHGNGIPYS